MSPSPQFPKRSGSKRSGSNRSTPNRSGRKRASSKHAGPKPYLKRKSSRVDDTSASEKPKLRGSKSRRQDDADYRARRDANDTPKSSSVETVAIASAPEEEDDTPDLIYGRRVVLTALEEKRSINRIWVASHVRYNPKFHSLLEAAKRRGATIDELSPRHLSGMVAGGNHQGIVAQVAPYSYANLDMLLEKASQARNPIVLIGDGIQDPHNLGAIIRSAEAMGAIGLIVPQRRAVGVTSTVVRVAAGALETFPVARVGNINRAITELKEAGFWVYGATVDGDRPLHTTEFDGPVAIVVGAEGKGIGLHTQSLCDITLSIPLAGRTASLNVSVATGMILYEISRQRHKKTLELAQ